jgi:prepilin-type N-terminal cleavage/methylation domain-containing protein
MRSSIKSGRKLQAGFSLIEVSISVFILVIVMAVVFRQINNVQRTTKTESMKLDLVQESREFVDQFARDIHMAEYPAPRIYQNYGGLTDNKTASGLIYVSATDLIFEGDVYGDGNVYRVEYKYFPSDVNDANCPCVRRSVTQKTTADPLTGYPTPIYYTEVQNVLDPAGMTEQIFTFFQASGALVDVDNFNGGVCGSPSPLNSPPAPGHGCADIETNTANVALIQSIDAIKVNLSTRSKQYDPQTGAQHVNSISSIAELEN